MSISIKYAFQEKSYNNSLFLKQYINIPNNYSYIPF